MIRMSDTENPIRAYRERQTPPLSQGQFGDRVGVTRFTVMRWENGSPIDEERLPDVSREIGIPARELRPDLADKYDRIFGDAP